MKCADLFLPRNRNGTSISAYYASLDGGGREGGMDGVLEPGQPVAAGDDDVGDAAVAQVGHHIGPEPGALTGGRGLQRGLGQPDAQHMLLAVGVNAGRQVGGLALHDVVVATLTMIASRNTTA